MNNRAPGTLAVGRVKYFGRHHGEVNSSAFSPNGQTLLTASDDGCVYGWETQTGQLLWKLGGHTGAVKFCRFSPDGRLFASTSCDCTIRLWDVARAKCLQVLKGHQRSVETVSFSPDSRQLASGGWDKRVMLWEVQASGSWDKTIRIWKPQPASLLVQLKGHVTWVKSIAFSPNELWLVSAGYSRLIKVWDCNTGKCIETLKVRAGGCSTQVAKKAPREGWEQEGPSEPSAMLLAGNPGCGPFLCLHPRWETPSVWSC
ncbi:WD repeat-containing protein 38 isoform X7 [Elephas maximus indicus]|uniref:WD repeat-containing protein 38 isoform X7 n=1 Tax=Elephas maximus indicus TaxID=99487 RepID=UPI0021161793|nr:WD repeat-containing protein 38 isoform X7 [Elephas maximus indicus]